MPRSIPGFSVYEAKIDGTGTVTNAVGLNSETISAIVIPAVFAAATLSFQGSADGVNFFPIRNIETDTPIIVPVTAGGYYPINPVILIGALYLKIVSDSAQQVGNVISVVSCAAVNR